MHYKYKQPCHKLGNLNLTVNFYKLNNFFKHLTFLMFFHERKRGTICTFGEKNRCLYLFVVFIACFIVYFFDLNITNTVQNYINHKETGKITKNRAKNGRLNGYAHIKTGDFDTLTLYWYVLWC